MFPAIAHAVGIPAMRVAPDVFAGYRLHIFCSFPRPTCSVSLSAWWLSHEAMAGVSYFLLFLWIARRRGWVLGHRGKSSAP